ncbi:unnamed protein product [Meganyctiphanes norvegica]|uniref:CHK kinase-like domain-containing protein n=1 Tax=Meganyctiphanes norvegica TaxID=48144 RepID=A0AAV2PSV7_MEGNR
MALVEKLFPLKSYKEITSEWLQKMLTVNYGHKIFIKSWNLKQPEDRQGFLSEICYVTVNYEYQNHENMCNYTENDKKSLQMDPKAKHEAWQNEELRLFVKFFPETKIHIDFMVNAKLADKEVAFYMFSISKIFQDISRSIGALQIVPKIYYADCKDESLTIVQEDLSDQGFKTILNREGSTLQQTKVALKSIAIIHAIGLIYKNKKGKLPHLKKFDIEFVQKFLEPNTITLAQYLEGSPLSGKIKELAPIANQLLLKAKRISDGFLETVCHGDLWMGQLMFPANEDCACVLDWQFANIGNPIQDIMALLFMSGNMEILETHLTQILQTYWETLIDTLQKGETTIDISFEVFLQTVERLWLLGFIFLTASLHDFLGADYISDQRLRAAYNFLNNRKLFDNILKEVDDTIP